MAKATVSKSDEELYEKMTDEQLVKEQGRLFQYLKVLKDKKKDFNSSNNESQAMVNAKLDYLIALSSSKKMESQADSILADGKKLLDDGVKFLDAGVRAVNVDF